MRSAHGRHAFAALDNLIDRHYIHSMREKMTRSDYLIASLHTAEEALDAAIEAKEWYNASRWRHLINVDARELEKVLQEEDPATTMADVRYFEGFKYA